MLLYRLSTGSADPQLAGALATTDFQAQRGQGGRGEGLPVQARRLAQTAQPQLGVSNVSTDISCDGCSGTDTRTQVSYAWPYEYARSTRKPTESSARVKPGLHFLNPRDALGTLQSAAFITGDCTNLCV